MSGDKDLVWLPKDLAEKCNKADSYDAQRKIVEDLIDRKKGHFKNEILTLDEDLALFKGATIRFKDELDKVVSSQEDELEILYGRSCGLYDGVSKRAREIAQQLAPVEEMIDNLSTKMDKITKVCNDVPVYRVEEFVKLVDMVNNLDDKRFEVLAKLLEVNK